MSSSPAQTLALEDFLKLPYLEESPAWEYVNGVALQKPMPKTRHAILQKRLLNEIDNSSDEYIALPELRCTLGGRSVVPDVAVLMFAPHQEPEVLRGDRQLIPLEGINLTLTAEQIFDWLKIGRR